VRSPTPAPDTVPTPLALTERGVAPGADPADFLSGFEGEPRGFWGRGDRWVAWAGILAEVRLDPGPVGAGGPTGSTGDRFDLVRAGAARLTASMFPPAPPSPGEPSSGGPVASGLAPRLFGGFSFLDEPGENGSWSGFPAARFVLPRVVLEGGPEGVRLQVVRIGSGGSEGTETDVADEADRILAALEAGSLVRPTPAVFPEPMALEGELSEERGEDAWTRAVEEVLAAEGEAGSEGEARLEKAVLARTRDVLLPRNASVPRLLRFLRHENRRAHVFIFEPDPGRVLFGAAPEVLAELRDGQFHATAVAGSAPRGRTSHEEQLLAGGLLASAKDRAEHRMTLEEMVAALRPRLRTLTVPEAPGVLTLARIQHLETPIHGEAAPGEDILGLVQALHPTPAVCGRPRDAALALLRESEPFERGWYAGPVGWLDGSGDGDFVPALRIGVGGGRRWRLYAGAGIVQGSDPHSEWEETALKFEPAHRALRAAAAP
jgi:menaquinone-specific isochorismate synthase